MNAIESLRDHLADLFPRAGLTIDSPANESGSWFLDIRLGDQWLVVEWRPNRGFGLSTPCPRGEDYGQGPDEVYPDLPAALDRIIRLLLTGEPTTPPLAVRLRELRQGRGLTQQEVAELVGIRQSNVSKAEGRNDMLLSTLRKFVAALGGELEVRVKFPGGEVRTLDFDEVGTPDREGIAV